MTTINLASFNDTNNAFAVSQEEFFDMVMSSAKEVEGKWFASIPLSLIRFDTSYQRNEMIKESKLKQLAENWDERKCYPITVSPHPETSCFMAVDGSHRIIYKTKVGAKRIAAYVLMDLADMEPKARQKEEARLFAQQNDNVDRLTAVQKHDANVLIGNPANKLVQSLCDKYGIAVKPGKATGRVKMSNTLTGLAKALRIASREDNHLSEIFKVICNSGWQHGTDGFSGTMIAAIETLYNTHHDKSDEITTSLIKWFRNVEPSYIKSLGNTNYPMRKSEEVRIILVLEDHLHREIGLPYTYTEKHGIKIVEI